MGERNKGTQSTMVCAMLLVLMLPVCFSAMQIKSRNQVQSSLVLPVEGDIYRDGFLYTTIYLGNPLKPYKLDIDSGSHLTWVQCAAGPGANLLKAPNSPYKPYRNAMLCKEPLCAHINNPTDSPCQTPNDQCDYEVQYADHGSSLGVVVRDSFAVKLTNGSLYKPALAFGCGYDQEFSGSFPPYADGVLGLGSGKASIVSQLNSFGLTRAVIGHCFARQGKGFLFFGDYNLPAEIVWAPMLASTLNHYMLGPVDLLIGGKASGAKGLNVIFDTGSTYTYLNPKAYQATFTLIKKSLSGKPLSAVKDESLPVCWKGAKPIQSIDAVKSFFSPLALSLRNAKNVAFVIPPVSYLVVSSHGNVCLGILNGGEANLGDLNVIGDISMQDQLVVYDNERKMIGWSPFHCSGRRKL